VTLTGATLRLLFTSGSGSFQLAVKERHSSKLIFEGGLSELQDARRQLGEQLDGVKEAVMCSADEDAFVEFGDPLDSAFEQLLEQSLDLRSRLAGGNPQKAQSLLRVLRRALAHQPAGGEQAFIDVEAPRDLWVPVELLAYEHPPRTRVRDSRALRQACKKFVGFSAIIRRTLGDHDVYSGGLSQDRVLVADKGLPVTLFHDASLAAAGIERDLLASLSPGVDLQGPWPDCDLEEDTIRQRLMQHLFDLRTAVVGGRRLVSDQIQHFACHCDTTGPETDEYAIRLGAAGGAGAYISLAQIRKGLARAAEQTDGQQPSLPLIFLNACGSASVDYRGAASFPARFLSAGNRGFIGTETNIPDVFAARFAERFYSHLLSGDPVGRALNKAKWDMTITRRNPLGILYTLYADPDLHIGPSAKEASKWKRWLKRLPMRFGSSE
jgi:hypothetical protein